MSPPRQKYPCPRCGDDTLVLQTYLCVRQHKLNRRRKCVGCDALFTTFERVSPADETFDRAVFELLPTDMLRSLRDMAMSVMADRAARALP